MQVIGKDHPAVDKERTPYSYHAHGIAQQTDETGQQVIAASLQEVDGEEIRTAGMPCASVVGHVAGVVMLCVATGSQGTRSPVLAHVPNTQDVDGCT